MDASPEIERKTMHIEEIRTRIAVAVKPQLDALEALHDRLIPISARVIGKHHPEYDTVPGRINNITRRLSRLLGDVWKLQAPAGPEVLAHLKVNCPSPTCEHEDAGYDHDVIMADYRKHRAECGRRTRTLQAAQ